VSSATRVLPRQRRRDGTTLRKAWVFLNATWHEIHDDVPMKGAVGIRTAPDRGAEWTSRTGRHGRPTGSPLVGRFRTELAMIVHRWHQIRQLGALQSAIRRGSGRSRSPDLTVVGNPVQAIRIVRGCESSRESLVSQSTGSRN